MAVTETSAAHLASTARPLPVDNHGKLRVLVGQITQGAAAGDDGSSVIIGSLPPGRVRVIPSLCWYKVSALGASRVMGIGHDAYYKRSDPTLAQEAAAAGAFGAAIDVSSATDAKFPVTAGPSYDMYSMRGVQLRATITGGTIPAAATFEFVVVYVYE